MSDIYGKGASFPLRVGTRRGLLEVEGVPKVEQSIRIILGTQYGERAMRPTFGSNLKSLVFFPNNDATANLARHYAEDALKLWEPRIDVLEVVATPDSSGGILLIVIKYRIRATQDVHSLIYPFYLENK